MTVSIELSPASGEAEWARVLAELNRRHLLGSGAVLALLTACGDGRTEADGRPAATRRTVVTDRGPIDVPAEPQRVVSLDQYSTLTLLDLGFPLAATIEELDDYILPHHAATYRSLPKVGNWQVNIEAVAAQRPDLILGNSFLSIEGHQLRDYEAIAPVVLVGGGSGGTPWQTWARQVSDSVNRLADLDQLEARYRTRAAGMRTAHTAPLRDLKWVLIRAEGVDSWSINVPSYWGGVVLEDLGARPIPVSEDLSVAGIPLSYERLSLLNDADVILYQANTDGTLAEGIRTLLGHPLWKRIPAVSAGRVRPLRNYYALHFGAGLALLDELEPILAERGRR